ncbi:hypothetical protein [Saccharopolyspora taberi]|uniref:Uncharacterized protein n=1 Tax=Saccharopolyspora taberi TaxID=60895 RepID=A0ABN3V4F5_9PSEU
MSLVQAIVATVGIATYLTMEELAERLTRAQQSYGMLRCWQEQNGGQL